MAALLSTPALAEESIRVLTEYDARGQVLRTSQPFRVGSAVRWREYRYDGIDRQVRLSHPGSGSVVTKFEPGEVFTSIETIDESGHRQVSHLDAFGNTRYQDRFDGNVRLRTTYEYDALNRLVAIEDGRGSKFWYAHDGHGNKVWDADPDLGCRTSVFDKASRLTGQRSATGSLVRYNYDRLGRVRTKSADPTALQFSSCQHAITPTAKTKSGSGANDVLDAGKERLADVVLSGGAGNDTYLIWAASGHVSIPASAESTGSEVDVVRFGDLKLEDLKITRQADPQQGDMLIFSWDRFGNTGSLKIAYLGTRIERFEFVDGSALAELRFRTDGRFQLYGTSGNDRMPGSRYDDFHVGMDGDDSMDVGPGNGTWQHPRGGRGNDTYIIGSNSGNLLVHEAPGAGSDKVVFKDLNLADLTFGVFDYGSGNPYGKTLKITWNLAGRRGEVRLSQGGADFERIEFADGSAVSAIRLRDDGRLELDGTGGNDRMAGSTYDDFHAGGDGNDILDVGPGKGSWQHPRGGAGNDTYILASDSGNTLVHEGSNAGTDTIRFLDLVPEELNISYFDYGSGHSLGNALQLTWNRGGRSGTLRISNAARDVEWIEFANGNRFEPSKLRLDGRNGITGTEGDDVLVGTSLDDFINGLGGNDVIDVAGGNGSWQHPRGDAGNDTYIIGSNSGRSLVHETPGNGTDTIRFSDLLLSDLSINYFDYRPDYGETDSRGKALQLAWNRDGLSGKVHVSKEGNDIEQIEFADGTAISRVVARSDGRMALNGTSGDDVIVGSKYDDFIMAGAGNDILDVGPGNGSWQHPRGEAGNDTYVIDSNSGRSLVHETPGNGTDTIRFPDLSLSDLSIKYFDYGESDSRGKALELAWSKDGSSGKIHVSKGGNDIEQIGFADATAISRVVVRSDGRVALTGTSGDDVIGGSKYDDFIMAGTGNDILDVGPGNGSWQHPRGEAGNDTYVIGSTSGRSLVHETPGNGSDTIRFSDLNLSDLSISYFDYRPDYGADDSRGNALELSWNKDGRSGKIHVSKEGVDIERYEFADGSAIADFSERSDGRLELHGTAGDDVLVGTVKDDFIYGHAGDDLLDVGAGNGNGSWQHPRGGDGNDTYVIGKNSGNIVVHEGTAAGSDTIRFKDLVLADFTFRIVASDASSSYGNLLEMRWSRDGFTGELRVSQEGKEIERFEFADGSAVSDLVWRSDGRLELHGTSGRDVLIGTVIDDFIYGHAGDDLLDVGAGNGNASWQHPRGGDGNDTYVIGKNSGNIVVHEGTAAGSDTIRFKDLVLADFTFRIVASDASSSYGNLLEMRWSRDGFTGELRVSQEGKEIERFEFADGSAVSDLVWRSDGRLELHGTSGHDDLIGTVIDDFIHGHAGDDLLDVGAGNGNGSWQHPRGGDGDDTYIIGKNSGNIVVHEGAAAGSDTIRFKDLVLADFTFRIVASDASSSYGNLLEMRWSRDGYSGELRVSQEGKEIEWFEFADGTVRTVAELQL